MEEKKQELAKPEAKLPIDINLQAGIMPHSYNELLQFARLYKESGLAPNSFQSVQQLAIAIGMCIEVGRPILTGLQDMAVINNRVGVFGDAILAIIRSSGRLEVFDQWEEGKEYTDEWVVHTKVKRKGYDEKTDRWSWLDSKRAGFDNPMRKDGATKDMYSPWRRFTRRMMYFKSRNFLLRDEFGDLLKGMKTVEELEEIVDLKPGQNGSYSVPSNLNDKLKGKPQAEAKEDIYEPKAAPEKEKEEKVEDKDDPIRAAYKNLKKTGFKPYVEANLGAIQHLAEKYQAEIRAKWEGFYPDEPFPGSGPVEVEPKGSDIELTEGASDNLPKDDEGNSGTETDAEKFFRLVDGAEDNVSGLALECPETNKGIRVLRSKCEGNCNSREGCPSWTGYDKE